MSNTNLPPGWVKLKDPSGQTYYANTITRETRWDPPPSHLPPPPPSVPRQQFASANNNRPMISNNNSNHNSAAGGSNYMRSYTNSGNLAQGAPNMMFSSSINYSSGVNTNGNMSRTNNTALVSTSVGGNNNNGKMQANNPYANTHNQGMNNTVHHRISLDNNVRDNNDNSKKKRVVHNLYAKENKANHQEDPNEFSDDDVRKQEKELALLDMSVFQSSKPSSNGKVSSVAKMPTSKPPPPPVRSSNDAPAAASVSYANALKGISQGAAPAAPTTRSPTVATNNNDTTMSIAQPPISQTQTQTSTNDAGSQDSGINVYPWPTRHDSERLKVESVDGFSVDMVFDLFGLDGTFQGTREVKILRREHVPLFSTDRPVVTLCQGEGLPESALSPSKVLLLVHLTQRSNSVDLIKNRTISRMTERGINGLFDSSNPGPVLGTTWEGLAMHFASEMADGMSWVDVCLMNIEKDHGVPFSSPLFHDAASSLETLRMLEHVTNVTPLHRVMNGSGGKDNHIVRAGLVPIDQHGSIMSPNPQENSDSVFDHWGISDSADDSFITVRNANAFEIKQAAHEENVRKMSATEKQVHMVSMLNHAAAKLGLSDTDVLDKHTAEHGEKAFELIKNANQGMSYKSFDELVAAWTANEAKKNPPPAALELPVPAALKPPAPAVESLAPPVAAKSDTKPTKQRSVSCPPTVKSRQAELSKARLSKQQFADLESRWKRARQVETVPRPLVVGKVGLLDTAFDFIDAIMDPSQSALGLDSIPSVATSWIRVIVPQIKAFHVLSSATAKKANNLARVFDNDASFGSILQACDSQLQDVDESMAGEIRRLKLALYQFMNPEVNDTTHVDLDKGVSDKQLMKFVRLGHQTRNMIQHLSNLVVVFSLIKELKLSTAVNHLAAKKAEDLIRRAGELAGKVDSRATLDVDNITVLSYLTQYINPGLGMADWELAATLLVALFNSITAVGTGEQKTKYEEDIIPIVKRAQSVTISGARDETVNDNDNNEGFFDGLEKIHDKRRKKACRSFALLILKEAIKRRVPRGLFSNYTRSVLLLSPTEIPTQFYFVKEQFFGSNHGENSDEVRRLRASVLKEDASPIDGEISIMLESDTQLECLQKLLHMLHTSKGGGMEFNI